jgi:hypothetical protein
LYRDFDVNATLKNVLLSFICILRGIPSFTAQEKLRPPNRRVIDFAGKIAEATPAVFFGSSRPARRSSDLADILERKDQELDRIQGATRYSGQLDRKESIYGRGCQTASDRQPALDALPDHHLLPIAINIRNLLPSCAFLVLLVSGLFGQSGADIPFSLEKGMLILKGTVRKDVPVEVIIATGSPDSLVNMAFVQQHKIVPGYTRDKHGEPVVFVVLTRIVIGDQKPLSLRMKASGLVRARSMLGREITASLGADYFKGKILQIDFKSRVIRFLDSSPIDAKTARSQLMDRSSSTTVLEMTHDSQTFLGLPVTLPVVDGVVINGARIKSLIDTAVPYPISVSAAAIKEFKLGSVPEKGTLQTVSLKSFSFAGLNIPDIPTKFVGKDADFDVGLSQYGTIIGVALLQNFKVTFDWKEKIVVFEPSR